MDRKIVVCAVMWVFCLFAGLYGQTVTDPETGLSYSLVDVDGRAGYAVARGTCEYTFITIPNTFRESPTVEPLAVLAIADGGFANNTDLQQIYLFNNTNLRKIGTSAFAGCSSLKAISISQSSSLNTIGQLAFSGCSSLSRILINASVETIGQSAFWGCSSLTIYAASTAELPGWHQLYNPNRRPLVTGYQYNFLYDEQGLLYEQFSLTASFYEVSRGFTNAERIAIPRGVEPNETLVVKIADNGFANYSELTHLDFGTDTSISEIGVSAFEGCSSLTGITIPNSVTEIKSRTFMGCAMMTYILLPVGLQRIGDEAFRECALLHDISFAPSPHRLELPPALTSIGDMAFAFCTSISNINIPSLVTDMGSNPFAGCSEDLVLSFAPGNAEFSMEGNCLVNLSDQRLITGFSNSSIPATVLIIDDYAFYNVRLSEIDLPDGLVSIGSFAFSGNDALIEIELPANLAEFGDDAFSDCASLDTVYIPNRHRDGGISRNTTLGERIFAGCPSLTSVTLPPSFMAITSEMFSGCTSLININLSDQVKDIGALAFAHCSALPNIQIPLSVETIGSQAFAGCGFLTIYVEADSLPIGWESDFNPDDRPIVWHCLSQNDDVTVVAGTRLIGNYPNPFNPSTTISFALANAGHVTIDIYNVRGQIVTTLVDSDFSTGNHEIVWNGTDHQGKTVSSGVYFYRMTAQGYTATRKMLSTK